MVSITQNFVSETKITGAVVSVPQFDLVRYVVTVDTVTTSGPTIGESEFKQLTTAGGTEQIQVLPKDAAKPFTLDSITPATATTNGDKIIIVGSGGGFNVRMTQSGGSVVISSSLASGAFVLTLWNKFTAGSNSDKLSSDLFRRMLADKDATLFANDPLVAAIPEWNMNCVLGDIDLSGIPFATTLFGVWSAANRGAAITKRHVVGNRHWQYSYPTPGATSGGYAIGQSFKFLDKFGIVHERKIIGVGYAMNDVVVAMLDSDLPDSVTPLQIAGDWFVRNVVQGASSCSCFVGSAMFFIDQFANCCIQLGESGQNNTQTFIENGHTYTNSMDQIHFRNLEFYSSTFPTVTFTPDTFAGKKDLRKTGIVGDSGSACCILSGTTPILIGTMWYGNACTNLSSYNGALVNEAIVNVDTNAGISTGYTVTIFASPL